MLKLLTFIIMLTLSLGAMELSGVAKAGQSNVNIAAVEHSVKVFGHNLFNGSFASNNQYRYNPNYRINIGDKINIKIWGAFELDAALNVDSQGNVFIPKVGTLAVVGTRNDELSKKLQTAIKKEFRSNVFVYADLASYQAVSVFVTGAVNKPGLYEGLSSDSVLQFLDKAKGIDASTGSYRNIHILRENEEILTLDLYSFLLKGDLQVFQFQMGDVVVVESVRNYLEITGDVKRPYRYELKAPFTTLDVVQEVVLANPTSTNVLVTRWTKENKLSSEIYKIADHEDLKLYAGESVEFIQDHQAQSITVNIEGEHESIHRIVVPKGTTLKKVFDDIAMSDLSESDAFQLFRRSVAKQQKELIMAALDDLEAKTLTAPSITTEEAVIRKQEAALVMNFIERAKKVQPKGQVVINEDTNLSKVLLEDEDTIYIPKKSYMVIVQGEVQLPGAQTYVERLEFDDYIDSCGGFGFRADEDNVLVIHRNGSVTAYDADDWFNTTVVIQPGDSILVLGEVDTKYLQAVKDITQIIYQIAVGAAVVLRY